MVEKSGAQQELDLLLSLVNSKENLNIIKFIEAFNDDYNKHIYFFSSFYVVKIKISII